VSNRTRNVSHGTLDAIQANDPDGGSVQPTPEMYAAFEAWAVENYGRDAWDAYRVGGWAEPTDPDDWDAFAGRNGYDLP
jgi:hypothetical protein